MNIKGIHHNVYRCRDSEETRRFYEEFLRLPLASAMVVGAGRALHTFYALGDGSFLAFFEVPNQAFEFKRQDSFDLHIALEIEEAELEPWLERARVSGIPMGDITDHGVVRSVYFHDPNGYVIELTAPTATHAELNDPSGARRNLDGWQVTKNAPAPSLACAPRMESLASAT
jgi:catechol 2,3-dioxygenase-like lactoylglutathione lyase family enzyme